jgi:hypothetical protein
MPRPNPAWSSGSRRSSWRFPVPRNRLNLQRCRARAKVIAAREGLRTEPDVISYDGRPLMGLLRDPQGWTFTFFKDLGYIPSVR